MELLGTRAASSFLGIPEATLRYWRYANQGPPSFKIGGRLVYRRDELVRWVAEQEKATRRGGEVAV
ncbi:transcriptional regulator [Mycolicibacterium conceptionense]|uniref:Transcriptional regulator n=1 Tax=Mycolicibacterium conceptionense TaxID=451644 RepID=A0A1A1XXS2_9MYCO|nr:MULTISPECIES: helix-turn-helix domain-containing protein [Mycolicibacterium]MCW1821422.1 helix-turn-helix domain-containing protein [Mycolicibacterium senegalense]OBB07551.1 transcriptional regulator [Mycolicibacterium conceptionense]OBF08585.1 transcriptional regulator [Mycolicibacterium conceptionense]OBF23889.1 transcriptional regulator [Mycolicibacterium conceptionense]OBF32059.1 transcriptional regulator [Mycolicibacterium conceptionense]